MLVERSDIVKRMRELGATYRMIADVFGISRQRVEQIANPEEQSARRRYYRETHRERLNERDRERYEHQKRVVSEVRTHGEV